MLKAIAGDTQSNREGKKKKETGKNEYNGMTIVDKKHSVPHEKHHMACNRASHIKTSIPFQLNKSEAHSPPSLRPAILVL